MHGLKSKVGQVRQGEMTIPHLVMVDTAQIQPYVFGSNRLRENIGASHLVAQATGEWALSLLDNPTQKIYAGGGNVVALFPDSDSAEKFTRRLSRRVLEQAPGLRLVIASHPFDSGHESLADALQQAAERLAVLKRSDPLSVALLGLSITQPCGATGLPATGLAPRRGGDPTSVYPASDEILEKIAAAAEAQARLTTGADGLPPSPGYVYPSDFDEMGRSTGEDSYIAVVHADGNGMGRRLADLARAAADDDACRQALEDFSVRLHRASLSALRATVGRLEEAYGDNREDISIRVPLRETSRGGVFFLPMRPLVFGGDDVTFVCDGRLGLALATCYLEAFRVATESLPGGPATACAGVAIVKTHYPFARAYEIADALCRTAKALHRDMKERNYVDVACLDWHFTSGGLLGELDTIRQREYDVPSGRLNLRPVALSPDAPTHQRWDVVRKGLNAFTGDGWLERRSKAKALREALRGGPPAVERFCQFYNASDDNPKGLLPDLGSGFGTARETGWISAAPHRCAYFDALELFDRFIPLDDASEDAG